MQQVDQQIKVLLQVDPQIVVMQVTVEQEHQHQAQQAALE
jgi:hypothetical protein